jgi:hypothetical protein
VYTLNTKLYLYALFMHIVNVRELSLAIIDRDREENEAEFNCALMKSF